jgi:hypothetical protein
MIHNPYSRGYSSLDNPYSDKKKPGLFSFRTIIIGAILLLTAMSFLLHQMHVETFGYKEKLRKVVSIIRPKSGEQKIAFVEPNQEEEGEKEKQGSSSSSKSKSDEQLIREVDKEPELKQKEAGEKKNQENSSSDKISPKAHSVVEPFKLKKASEQQQDSSKPPPNKSERQQDSSKPPPNDSQQQQNSSNPPPNDSQRQQDRTNPHPDSKRPPPPSEEEDKPFIVDLQAHKDHKSGIRQAINKESAAAEKQIQESDVAEKNLRLQIVAENLKQQQLQKKQKQEEQRAAHMAHLKQMTLKHPPVPLHDVPIPPQAVAEEVEGAKGKDGDASKSAPKAVINHIASLKQQEEEEQPHSDPHHHASIVADRRHHDTADGKSDSNSNSNSNSKNSEAAEGLKTIEKESAAAEARDSNAHGRAPAKSALKKTETEADPDFCSGHVDPFAKFGVENFPPPKKASFEKVQRWNSALEEMTRGISKLKIGGQPLRDRIKEEVARLKVMRFDLFCMYA